MKIKSLNYLLFTVSLSCFSQGQNDIHREGAFKIDIKKNYDNVHSINLSTLGKDVLYVPLETNSECLMKDIRSIEFSDSYIFVSDIDKVVRFDKKGKYLGKIDANGRGPGEYLGVIDFCINNELQEIYIISADRVYIFDFEGKFKKTSKLTFRPALVISLNQENLMFYLYNMPYGYSNPYSWVITSREGQVISTYKNNLKRVNVPGVMTREMPLYQNYKSVHFMEFGIDTLYYFTESKKEPYAIFNLGNLKMDPDVKYEHSRRFLEETNDKLWVKMVKENDKYLFITIRKGITGFSFMLYEKNTSNTVILKDDGFQNDLDGGIPFWPKYIINDNILVDHVEAIDMIKHIKSAKNVSAKLQRLQKQISETSNPILIVLD